MGDRPRAGIPSRYVNANLVNSALRPLGSINRVPALAGSRAEMSALPGEILYGKCVPAAAWQVRLRTAICVYFTLLYFTRHTWRQFVKAITLHFGAHAWMMMAWDRQTDGPRRCLMPPPGGRVHNNRICVAVTSRPGAVTWQSTRPRQWIMDAWRRIARDSTRSARRYALDVVDPSDQRD